MKKVIAFFNAPFNWLDKFEEKHEETISDFLDFIWKYMLIFVLLFLFLMLLQNCQLRIEVISK